MNKNLKMYCGFDRHSVIYDMASHTFEVYYDSQPIIKDACIYEIINNNKVLHIEDFLNSEPRNTMSTTESFSFLDMDFTQKEDETKGFMLRFASGNNGIYVQVNSSDDITVKVKGTVCFWGDKNDDVFAVCLDRNVNEFRCAVGQAVSSVDNAIYDRKNDIALIIGESKQTKFDQDNFYDFEVTVSKEQKIEIIIKENVLATKFNINFSPINRNSTFNRPPVGWMTWYAVKFDACEEKVLNNAKFQAENLKDFGANTIWVDYEWCHDRNYYEDRSVEERTDGASSLVPDPVKYPNGLKYVSDKIREMGLIPSLWIGFTHDCGRNEFIDKYPDMLLAEEVNWCGKYFYDFSNPHFLNDYLPTAIGNVHKWGYDAIKFDTIPICITKHEKYHMNMYDPSLSTKEAVRNLMKKSRELLGENMYMLSCSGAYTGDVLWASDIFDAARVGEDVFTWEEHVNSIERIEMFYPLHNIQFYNDPDNVVLRDEFSNYEQAKSRVALFSLLGLPVTFGDEFSVLSEEKIDLLKRSIPVLDVHPMDLINPKVNKDDFLVNLKIAKEYEKYQITGIFNTTDKPLVKKINLYDDLHLEDGNYLVYDFYRNEFLGKVSNSIDVDLLAHECRILSLRPSKDIPQIVSTSRHISQGAVEIIDMKYNNDVLSFNASLVANDRYTVSVFVPDNYLMTECNGFESYTLENNILRLSVVPNMTQEYNFSIAFKKN